jgi:hypothetical protein
MKISWIVLASRVAHGLISVVFVFCISHLPRAGKHSPARLQLVIEIFGPLARLARFASGNDGDAPLSLATVRSAAERA